MRERARDKGIKNGRRRPFRIRKIKVNQSEMKEHRKKMPVNSPLKRSMALTMADHRTKVAITEMSFYG